MSYPQGYLYQAPGSLALYSCPAYGASALAAPRSEELARSASGSAFSPYPGSAAFTAQAATGFGSPLQYSADAAAAAAGFPSYMVTARRRVGGDAGHPGDGTAIGARGRGESAVGCGSGVSDAGRRSTGGTGGRSEKQRGQLATSLSLEVRFPLALRVMFPKSLKSATPMGSGICAGLYSVHAPKPGEGCGAGRGARLSRLRERGSAPLEPPGRLPGAQGSLAGLEGHRVEGGSEASGRSSGALPGAPPSRP